MKKENREVFRALGLISQLGLTIVVTISISIFIGIKMDKVFRTDFWFIIWLIIGIMAGVRNIYMIVRKFYLADKDREDKELQYFAELKADDKKEKK